jgi:pyridoxal 5'-phosphate synthase / NAD(P)H-hydrate epimerase
MTSREVSSAAAAAAEVTHLSQRNTAEIDEQLMGPLGFSVDQVMVGAHLLLLLCN